MAEQQEILKGLIEPLNTITTFAVQKSKTDKDNHIIDEIKSSFDNLDLQKPVTNEHLVDAIFDVLEIGAALTETKADDKLVKMFERLYKLYTGSKPLKEMIEGIRQRIKERRKARKQKRKDKKEN